MTTDPIRRPFVVATLPADGAAVDIVADAAERDLLAKVNGLPSVERFVARLDVRPAGRDGISVRGRLEAEATRICVVTLEPFVEEIREEIELRYAPEGADGDMSAADDERDDAPDPIVGGVIDLGAAAVEFFTLGLDPHPRKPGAAFDASALSDDSGSPFSALEALKRRGEGS